MPDRSPVALESKAGEAQLRLSQRAGWAGGQPISYLMAQALEHPELISLAAGFVDAQTLPIGPTKEAIDALFAEEDVARAALQYGSTIGHAPLRDAIRNRMTQQDQAVGADHEISVEQIVMTAGSNQLLQLVGETLLDPGDIVLCAAPSYFVFLGTLANQGARSVGVPMDEQGMIPEALEETLKRLDAAGDLRRVKAIYCVSYFDNPCSVSISTPRRAEIVEIAKRWSHTDRIHVIEDAAYRELRYEGEDLPSMRAFDTEGDTVIVAGTFSKSFSPGLRVGWGVLPSDLVEPILAQKGNFDFGSPNFAQKLIAKVLEMGLYDQHVEQLQASYRLKLQAMLSAADKFLAPLSDIHWTPPNGGLYVWLTLPEEVDTGPEGQLFKRSLDSGVLYVPGQYCFPHEGPRPKNTIRLSFGVQSAEAIHRGIEALAQAIQ